MISFKTSGVCSRKIDFEIKDNKVYDVKFLGGCDGNLQGLGKLVDGMEISEVIDKLKGIQCGGRPTSCPDQLAAALEQEL